MPWSYLLATAGAILLMVSFNAERVAAAVRRRVLRKRPAPPPGAVRVRHEGARLPPPTPELLEAMARWGFEVWHAYCGVTCGIKPPRPWDEQPEWYREAWRQLARAMYAQVALAGGGVAEPIREGGE